ncbi:MAG: hypothetical protein PVJ34_11085 [Anaerolineae bacterium]
MNLKRRRTGAFFLCCSLGLILTIFFIAACGAATPAAEPSATSPPVTLVLTDTPTPRPTAAEVMVTVTSGAASDTIGPEAVAPDVADLKAAVEAGLPPAPTPDASGAAGAEALEIEVGVLPLETGTGNPPLWAAYSMGMGFYNLDEGHFVAIYGHDAGEWQELARTVLTGCAQYVGQDSLAQVYVEPSRIWLEMQSGAGAHGGCYDLLSFDGGALRQEVSHFNSSPGAGNAADLDGDGLQEVVLNETENYVFCYACGVRLFFARVLRWDGDGLVEVALEQLPETAPEGVRRPNNRAVALAEGQLWRGAQRAIQEALLRDAGDPEIASLLEWNRILIDLHAEARAEQVEMGIYPLLENAFYGDYAGVLDAFRPYDAGQIWASETPLVAGSVAEGWETALSQWISWATNLALEAEPELAPAYFLRGWGTFLVAPGDPAVLADVRRAAALSPGEALYADSVAYLEAQAPAGGLVYEPLDPDTCYDLGQGMMQALAVTVTLTTAPFQDPAGGGAGSGCRAAATGLGTDFEDSWWALADRVAAILQGEGWTQDGARAADGPSGTIRGFRRDGALCLLSAGWELAPGVECPADRPIVECDLTPEQQVYHVGLNCARGVEAAPPTMTPPPTATRSPLALPSPTPTARAALTPLPEEAWEVRTLLAGPGEPGRLYALQVEPSSGAWPAERARFLISDDYGGSWVPFPGGLPPQGCVRNVNLDYATPDALYASTCEGLFRWRGDAWELLSTEETGMVAVVYGQPEIVWATDAFGGDMAVMRSEDGGRTWQPAGYNLIHFNGVANLGIDPRDANTLYAIIWPKYAGTYLRRGASNGQWQVMPTPKNNTTINTGMTIDGASGALYVMVNAPHAQLWRSLDPRTPAVDDVTWEMVHDFGTDLHVDLLASGWSPDGLALYANFWPLTWVDAGYAEVGDAVLHRSLDGGLSWSPLPLP